MNYGIELHLSPELLPVMMVGDPFSVCRYAQARYSRMWILSQVGLKKAQSTVEDLPPPAAPEAIHPIPFRVLDPSKIKGD